MVNIDLLLKKILIKSPLLKPIIDWAEFVPTSLVNSGSTDGKRIFYNPAHFEQSTEAENIFTLVHELMHIALDHMKRKEGRVQFAYNYACDAVENQIIKSFGIPIPEGCVDCPDAEGYSAEEYYEIVINRPDYEDLKKRFEGDPQSRMAPHTDWGTGGDDLRGKPESVPADEKAFVKKNREIKEKLAEDYIDNEVLDIDSEKAAGLGMHKEVHKELGSVGDATSFANWEDLLIHQVTKNRSSYDFFNGEFDSDGIWTYPYHKTKKEAEVEILIDTSYSVSNELVKAFLREVKSIVGNARIKLGSFDDKFGGWVDIKDESDIDNYVITARGGTDFEVAVKAFESPTSTKIVFTDGGAPDPKSFCEAIWVVYSHAKINPPGGFVYNVDPSKILGQGRTI